MEIKKPEEVALRHAIAMFRMKMASAGEKGSIPKVGIFWIGDRGTMYVRTVSLLKAGDYGDFKIFDGSHFEIWEQAVRANPKWEGLEYEQVPRGRVVYRKDPKKPEFIVYMPRQIVKYKTKVISRFNLPSGYIRIDTSDEHYQV